MNKFRIGSRVKRIDGGDLYRGVGTIKTLTNIFGNIGVEWDGGHDDGSGNYPHNLELIINKTNMSKKLKTGTTFYIEVDEDGPSGNVWNTEADVLNSCSGGEQILEVKSVKQFQVVDESVKLVEVK